METPRRLRAGIAVDRDFGAEFQGGNFDLSRVCFRLKGSAVIMKRAIAWRTKRAQCKQIKSILICRPRITDDYGESIYHTFVGKICRENKGNTITPENVYRPNAHEGVYSPEAYRDMNSRGAALRFPALLNARAYSGSSRTSLFTNRANKSSRVLSFSLSLSLVSSETTALFHLVTRLGRTPRVSRPLAADSPCWRFHPTMPSICVFIHAGSLGD